MRTRIVRIGSSWGVPIPKRLLEETGLHGEVEIRTHGNSLIIRPAKHPCAEWAASFQEMARRGDDAMLDDAPNTSVWDDNEWKWR